MRKFGLTALVVTAVTLSAIACNDNTLQPGTSAKAVPIVPGLDRTGSKSFEFDIPVAGGTIDVGGAFSLTIPSNAVCALTSPYGAAHWNDTCAPEGQSVHVRSKIFVKNGRLYVDFKPALRFSPDAEVIISTSVLASQLAAQNVSDAASLRHIGILYSPTMTSLAVDEVKALGDLSLVTHVDLATGRVWRRVKHFSGYNIAVGIECDLTLGDPNCIDVDVIPGR